MKDIKSAEKFNNYLFLFFCQILLLLTNRVRGPYRGILARRVVAVWTKHSAGSYKNKQGPIKIPQYGPERVRLVSSLLYGITIIL